ncbi:uncharacterized protein LOC130076253 [Rhinichthys klamathensis goyatoka]|uniref:uncharacterized protein LOC130076253 n=1 Tax=Rhinichthys klamathensis goyatoka TaxID=3034132 RepID=UPI0024B5A3A3|nr:uncharacterized protein LOC130076253 [Rhinichthys klamathensis goyatoka]
MSTSFRDVSLEIYVNGVFHSSKSFQISAEEDAEVEFRVTDAIYDIFGSSAVINSQVEVDTPEDMPVSSSVLEGGAVQDGFDVKDSTSASVERDGQLENDAKNVFSVLVSPTEVAGSSSGIDASPETPENSPTGPSNLDLADSDESCVPGPRVSEQETQVDLVDLEESSVSGLNRSEPEPVSSEGQEVEVRDAISDLKSPTLVCDDLSDSAGPSGRTSGIDQGGMDASPETPVKISPKESTKVRKKGKIGVFFQKLFRIDPAVPETLCLPDASVPEPEPELDLVDPKESCVPFPSNPEPEPELDLVDPKESCVPFPSNPEPEPELDLVDPKESCVPFPSNPESKSNLDLADSDESCVPGPRVSEQETQVDLVDLEESSVSGLNRSEPEPVSSEGQEVEVRDAISDLKSPTLVCDDLSDSAGPSGRTSGIDQGGMDASPETPVKISPKESTKVRKKGKIGAFFQKLFRIDPAVPETLCLPDASVPEPEPELDLVDPKESCVPFPSNPEPEPELDLVDPKESCVPFPSNPEPEPELDLVDPKESCVPFPSNPEPEPELDLVDPKESCVLVPSNPEPEPELDLVDPKESCVPFPSNPEPEPEFDLVDPKESCVPLPSNPEPEPELDLFDPKESCVPVPSVPESKSNLDLADSDESCVPGPSVPEMDSESDLSDSYESCVAGPSFLEMDSESDLSDSYESCVSGPSFPEMDSESDLSDSYESCVSGPSFPEMDSESDLSDSDESCVAGPSFPEMDFEWDLSDSDESCVAGPSVPYACTSEQELVQEETGFRLEERVKGCTKHLKSVTEVWNNIFIGNQEIAEDRMILKELGITHILNAAAVKKKLRVMLGVPWEQDLREAVNTGAKYYRGMNITYCGLPTTHSSNISKYFLPAAKFIHKARKNPENKVFIHCTEGVSYAPTLFLAYLMIHHYMTAEEAIDYLIQVRYIKPDVDFLKQLEILNEELKHNTATTYRRENNIWIKKLAAKILQKKCCRTQIKKFSPDHSAISLSQWQLTAYQNS